MKTAVDIIRDINKCKYLIDMIREEERILNNDLYFLEIVIHDRLDLLHSRKMRLFRKLAILGEELNFKLRFC